ncbi:MAG: hypothetical protein SAJ12_24585, partial [Jaaginema sp. PMC 1079.18]|nr:hypothetical protein [Jaaginema sp. PMC 1079.18]
MVPQAKRNNPSDADLAARLTLGVTRIESIVDLYNCSFNHDFTLLGGPIWQHRCLPEFLVNFWTSGDRSIVRCDSPIIVCNGFFGSYLAGL